MLRNFLLSPEVLKNNFTILVQYTFIVGAPGGAVG